MIIKGGMITAAPMGDINASIPTPQPVHYRPMFGALPEGVHASCITFLSQVAIDNGVAEKLGLKKMISPAKNTRSIRKTDMKHNDYLPIMEVDPETYVVKADGVHLTCEPADVLPMAQRYFLF
jgi:urease subunit alpha